MLFPNNQPHSSFQIYVIFFILLLIYLLLSFNSYIFFNTCTKSTWHFLKPRFINIRFIIAPKDSLIMLVQKSKNKIIVVMLLKHIKSVWSLARNYQIIAENNSIIWRFYILLIGIVNHTKSIVRPEWKFLIVVLLILISIKTFAVKIKKTMWKFVTSKSSNQEVRAVSLVKVEKHRYWTTNFCWLIGMLRIVWIMFSDSIFWLLFLCFLVCF